MNSNIDNALELSNLSLSVEDACVSTIGFLAGITVIGINEKDIIIVTIISVLIGAISISVGTYISNDTLVQDSNTKQDDTGKLKSILITFFSSFITGIILTVPYMLFKNKQVAMHKSVIIAIVFLFFLGIYDAHVINTNNANKNKKQINKWFNALKFAFLGILSIGSGLIAGNYLKKYIKK
jgi:VIT1/CCC1 family predicted Fe2+/Mn2+ transporter